MIDFTCDLNCPVENDTCCRYCYGNQEGFVNERNKHLWRKFRGFGDENGCRLPREQMPPECRKFDCRQFRWLVEKIWFRGEWVEHNLGTISPGKYGKAVDITWYQK